MFEFVAFDVIGIAAFTISGYFYGLRRRLDLFGIAIIAFATAFSGGIVRDAILSRTPVVFVKLYPVAVFLAVLALLAVLRRFINESIQEKKLFIVSDSIGLGTFYVIGALTGLEHGLNYFGVIFAGVITAVGGSLARNILANRLPYVMTQDIYGTIALAMAICICVLHFFALLNFYTLLALIGVGVYARLIVVKKRLHLPRFGY